MAFPYKHFLVIGATSGIGRALAERLLEHGAKVTAVGRRQDRLDEFVRKYGEEKAQGIAFDIAQTEKTPQFAKDVMEKYPDIDSVFLNAGYQRSHNLTSHETFDLEQFQHEVHVNFTSIVALVHAFLPYLKEKEETTPVSFIITGTNIAIVPAATVPAYSASKTALNVFTLCLREQLRQSTNIKVIEISPPAVQTELHDYMGPAGPSLGMPIDQFISETFKGLQDGSDQIVVGSIGPNEMFLDILHKRRTLFEKLAEMMRGLKH